MNDPLVSEPTASPGRRRRGRLLLVAGLVAVVLIGGAVAWFEPHKLLVDDRVDEALPVVVADGGGDPTAAPDAPEPAQAPDPGPTPDPGIATTTTTAPPAAEAEPEPGVLSEGSFSSIDRDTSGRALVLDVGGDGRVVRLEDLATDNGPDLFVYLSAAALSEGEAALDDDVVDLGRLKGNLGDQNYEVPAGVDLDRYRTVVIWCRRFSSGFGAAELR